MSLEEVEASMRAQAKKPSGTQLQTPVQQEYRTVSPQPPSFQPPAAQYEARQASPQRHVPSPAQAQPMHILQNPNRVADHRAGLPLPQSSHPGQHPHTLNAGHQAPHDHLGHHVQPQHSHRPHHSGSHHVINNPQHLMHLSEEDRAAFLLEDAKRAKRNHKIHMLSRGNGLMTPQDKNFITRIQLQQLVTATGNPNEHGTDSSLTEDFYYQVHNQIRGGPRQHPNQPLSHFAQTYLFQTGGRQGGMRRQARGGENHVQRMEQQVQRAVEAAKNKPKNKQLIIEGSLGKISFSNSKTPKPLLNIKRADSGNDVKAGSSPKPHKINLSGSDRKTVLTDIENVYTTLMKMEDHDRKMPPPVREDVDPELVGLHMDWREKAQLLNHQLWTQLKVHEPIGATTTHPFIAFLSFNKGKKCIPRVFRHISQEQRTTILTMIVVHLDQLDVVQQAQLVSGQHSLTSSIRENVELFSIAVMPSLFTFLSEAGLDIVTGILGLILGIKVDMVARTRIGLSMLTMILSRAELIKQAGGVGDKEWDEW